MAIRKDKKILDSIDSPKDLRRLSVPKLKLLAEEVRELIIETVSEKGGHLGAGLGATDLTIALHYVLNTPEDFLVWDIGHQVQAHKILTGRRDAFRKTFRQYKGISGLVNKDESEYDAFTTGHGGSSISACLGVAVGRRLASKKGKVVAVIGDASIPNGMAFEALNHAGHMDEDLVVILNDNEMSISKSVGALSKYLNRVISNPMYNRVRKNLENLITRLPGVGKRMINTAKHIEEGIKHLMVPGLVFEALGFRYFGPLDGHNIEEMVKILPNIFKVKGPVFVHVITKKGKGYPIAEKEPERWHASPPFVVETGELKSMSKDESYTSVFGHTLVEIAKTNRKVTALTAGMVEGTGLVEFAKAYPDRFFDVGISEEHGVTFCAGLAEAGLRPACVIYSTFLQRSHDQIIHDVALQRLPVMFFLDRAGLVGEDGPTHHGVFDVAYLRKVPGLVFLAPRDGEDFKQMIRWMTNYTQGPSAVRYPRGAITEAEYPELLTVKREPVVLGKPQLIGEGTDVLFIALGSMVGPCLRAAKILEREGIQSTVMDMRFVKPLDRQTLVQSVRKAGFVITVEESSLMGGAGAAVLECLSQEQEETSKVHCLGIPDRFIEAANRKILLDMLGLTPEKIAVKTRQILASGSHFDVIK